MNFGKSIKTLRKHLGITQVTLASKVGITPEYLSDIERGSKKPNYATLEKISDALSTTVPALFFLSIEESDLKPNKWELYNDIAPTLEKLIKGV